MIIESARDIHIAPWLDLVREVEPLFGPMPNFEATLRRNIARGSAYCALDGEVFAGGMLLSGAPPHYEIAWLAVPVAQRRRGAGDALLSDALMRLAPPCTVTLDTFREEEPDGRPARRLYEKYGFAAGELFEFDGMARQRFTLQRL